MKIMAYMDVGQPNEDHGCESPCAECESVREALRNLAAKLDEQAGAEVQNGYWWERP